MRRPSPLRLPLAPLALLAAFALPVPEAAAQFGRSPSRNMPRLPSEAPREAPPALPGLQYRRPVEPIPGDPTQNLSPSASLFDAINRGDIAAAREAVSRGADIEARNVLGLTPIDAAVDQGRTDIMFYLLSVRGGMRTAGPPPEAAAAPPPPARGRRTPERAAARAPEPTEAQPVPMPARVAPNARLWAGDGGSPRPELGFLGFDAGRPAGAVPPAREPAARSATRAPRSNRG